MVSTTRQDTFGPHRTGRQASSVICGNGGAVFESELTLTVNNYFGPTIYNALGYGGTTTLLINGISGAWGSVVTFIFITFLGTLT
jgi:hypothetical protein